MLRFGFGAVTFLISSTQTDAAVGVVSFVADSLLEGSPTTSPSSGASCCACGAGKTTCSWKATAEAEVTKAEAATRFALG